MNIKNWLFDGDSLASQDVIDLYFVQSDLKDIRQDESELYQQRVHDARCQDATKSQRSNDTRPIGKRVY